MRIQVVGPTPVPLRIGQTVSVAMTPEVEPLGGLNRPSLALEAVAIPPDIENIHHAFWQQLSVLRNLKQAGARESTLFPPRLSNYNAFLVALNNLFKAVLDLDRHRDEAWSLASVQPEMASFLAAIREEFELLSVPRAPGEPLRPGRLNEAYGTFEAKVNELREGVCCRLSRSNGPSPWPGLSPPCDRCAMN